MTGFRRFVTKHSVLLPLMVTLLTAFLYVSGIPFVSLLNIHFADIEPIYFSLLANILFASLMCILLMKMLCPTLPFPLRRNGVLHGLKAYGLPGLIVLAISLLAFHLGLTPYNNTPTPARVIVEVILYNFAVAFIEELFLRGLLLNIFRKLFEKKRNGLLLAVLLSSILFGLGHLPGILGASAFVVVGKVIWTIGLGVYLAAVYVKTDNLWCSILLHGMINLCSILYCFSTTTGFPTISVAVLVPLYLATGIASIVMILGGRDRVSQISKVNNKKTAL